MSVSPVSKHMSLISATGKLSLSSSNNGLEIFKKQATLVSFQNSNILIIIKPKSKVQAPNS